MLGSCEQFQICFWPAGLNVAISNSRESELAQRELLGIGERRCRTMGMPIAACWTRRYWKLRINSVQWESMGRGLGWVCRHVRYAVRCLWTCFAPGVPTSVLAEDVLQLLDNV